MRERRNGKIPCEICEVHGASDIKGGEYNQEFKMWFVCKECVKKIKDRRGKNAQGKLL